jgi:colanic acid biosynthesis glycosyl transferase WcaI
MRLHLFSYNYAPEPTGIPYYNTELATWLARRARWEVTVYTGIPHYPWWRVPAEYQGKRYWSGRGDEVMSGVRVQRVPHYVPTAPVSGRKRMALDATWLLSAWLRTFVARRRPHVILLVAPPFLSGLLGMALRWRWRVPVVYHVQDLQVDAAIDLGMLNARLAGALGWLERLVLPRMDLVTTVSPGMGKRLQRKAPVRRPVELFPNWTDTARMRPVSGQEVRAEWGVAPDELVVAYSGNLGKKQGLDVLLRAFALLERRPEARFVLAGEGAERDALEALASELGLSRLRFLPLAPQERLAEFLCAADVHCIPQRQAMTDLAMPSKLLNIMAVARPVVATADPASYLGRFVRASGCGLVVDTGSADALAGGIAQLLDDPALRERCGVAGRRFVAAHLSIERVLGRFARRMASLVGQHRASGGQHR